MTNRMIAFCAVYGILYMGTNRMHAVIPAFS